MGLSNSSGASNNCSEKTTRVEKDLAYKKNAERHTNKCVKMVNNARLKLYKMVQGF